MLNYFRHRECHQGEDSINTFQTVSEFTPSVIIFHRRILSLTLLKQFQCYCRGQVEPCKQICLAPTKHSWSDSTDHPWAGSMLFSPQHWLALTSLQTSVASLRGSCAMDGFSSVDTWPTPQWKQTALFFLWANKQPSDGDNHRLLPA